MNPAPEAASALVSQVPILTERIVQGGVAVVALIVASVACWALVQTARELARVQEQRVADGRADALADRDQTRALTTALTEFRGEIRTLIGAIADLRADLRGRRTGEP